jgi:hypothetical protein
VLGGEANCTECAVICGAASPNVDKLMLAENTLVIGRPREFLEVSSISK